MSEVIEVRNMVNAMLGWYQLPFWRDGVLGITDGRMLVTLKCDEPEKEFECRRFIDGKWTNSSSRRTPPDFAPLLSGIGRERYLSLPAVEGPPSTADACWQVPDTCERCKGSGECECDMGHIHDCTECDGTGTVDVDCEEGIQLVEIGAYSFRRKYLWLFNQLPGVRLFDITSNGMLRASWDHGFACVKNVERGRNAAS